jgi:peptide/nickel transport system substrate-binding protein
MTVPARAAEPLRLTVGTLGPIGSLDPRTGTSQVAREVWNLQYPTLTTLDPTTLDPAPGLARSWSPAPDGRGWIYTLRLGLRWSDGRAVTATDVADAVRRAKIGSTRVLGARRIEIDGPSAPGALVNVTPVHVLRSVSNLDKDLRALGVGDGPWHVTARTADSVQLDATDPAGPPLRQIVFRTYPNSGALIDALDRGAVDVASGLSPADATRLGASSNVTVDPAPDGTQYQLRDNLADTRVRQAISLAIDRTALVAETVDGMGTPGVVPIVARGAAWETSRARPSRPGWSGSSNPMRSRGSAATTSPASCGRPKTRLSWCSRRRSRSIRS